MHLALGRDAAPADVDQEVPLRVFAVTPAGAPRAGAPVVVEVTAGEVVALAEVAPGELAATWRLPPGRAEPATATVRLADEEGLGFEASLARPAGAPARLALEADPVRTVAGQGPPVALRVAVTDAMGNPVAAEPRLETTLGDRVGAGRGRRPARGRRGSSLPATALRATRHRDGRARGRPRGARSPSRLARRRPAAPAARACGAYRPRRRSGSPRRPAGSSRRTRARRARTARRSSTAGSRWRSRSAASSASAPTR